MRTETEEQYAARMALWQAEKEEDARWEALTCELDGGERLNGADVFKGPMVDASGVARVLAYLDGIDSERACSPATRAAAYLGGLAAARRMDSASRAAVVMALRRIVETRPRRHYSEEYAELKENAFHCLGAIGLEARVALPAIMDFLKRSHSLCAAGTFWRIILADEEGVEAITQLAEAYQLRIDEEVRTFQAAVHGTE